MRIRSQPALLLAALLAIILCGAQLHCCLDLTSQSVDSHLCPVCSTTGTAIVMSAPSVAMAPAVNRLEDGKIIVAVPLVTPRAIAPRAPPLAR